MKMNAKLCKKGLAMLTIMAMLLTMLSASLLNGKAAEAVKPEFRVSDFKIEGTVNEPIEPLEFTLLILTGNRWIIKPGQDLTSSMNIRYVKMPKGLKVTVVSLNETRSTATFRVEGTPTEAYSQKAIFGPKLEPNENCVFDIKDKVLVEKIEIRAESDTLEVGKQMQMSAQITPDNAADRTFEWSVENGTGEATINENGLLTAHKAGNVTVIATANDGSKIRGSYQIENIEPTPKPEEPTIPELPKDPKPAEVKPIPVVKETGNVNDNNWLFTGIIISLIGTCFFVRAKKV